ncbi:MAG: hypothetical protein ACTSU2_01895 [Promethearchaeota archaeon]
MNNNNYNNAFDKSKQNQDINGTEIIGHLSTTQIIDTPGKFIDVFSNVPYIKGYFIILGGGKFGHKALDFLLNPKFIKYYRSEKVILIIDKDEHAIEELIDYTKKKTKEKKIPAHLKITLLRDIDLNGQNGQNGQNDSNEYNQFMASLKRLHNLYNGQYLGKYLKKNRPTENNKMETTISPGNGGHISSPSHKKKQAQNIEIFLLNKDFNYVINLLKLGIPELIIPVIPVHIAAKLCQNLIEQFSIIKNKNSVLRSAPIDDFLKIIPQNLILAYNNEVGIITLSYARPGEVCPDDCPSPPHYCPTFKRIKPKTITQIACDLQKNIALKQFKGKGWVFESHQLAPGLGGLFGYEFIRNYTELFKYIEDIMINNNKNSSNKNNIRKIFKFFIATTCNCHGVLNAFEIKKL